MHTNVAQTRIAHTTNNNLVNKVVWIEKRLHTHYTHTISRGIESKRNETKRNEREKNESHRETHHHIKLSNIKLNQQQRRRQWQQHQHRRQQNLFITPFISKFNIFNPIVRENANGSKNETTHEVLRIERVNEWMWMWMGIGTNLVQSECVCSCECIQWNFSVRGFSTSFHPFLFFFSLPSFTRSPPHFAREKKECVCFDADSSFHKEANQCRDTCVFVISFSLRFHLLIIVNANQIQREKSTKQTQTQIDQKQMKHTLYQTESEEKTHPTHTDFIFVESMFNVEISKSLCDSSILFCFVFLSFVRIKVSNTVAAIISQSPIAISRTFTHFLFVRLLTRSFLCGVSSFAFNLMYLKRKTCTHKSMQTNKKKMKQKCNSQVLLRCKNYVCKLLLLLIFLPLFTFSFLRTHTHGCTIGIFVSGFHR